MQSIDTTTISGIRKTNDMILRSLINGSLDSRVVGATNSIIANQIRLLQQEETVEELTKTKKYLYDTQVAYFELASCQADQDLWFFSGLTEMLPQPLTDAINEFLEKKGEEIARTNPQINRWAYEYAFGKQSERWTAEAKAKMSPEQRAKWNPVPLPSPNVCIALFYMRRVWAHKYQYPLQNEI